MIRFAAALMALGVTMGLCASCVRPKPKPTQAEMNAFVEACKKPDVVAVKESLEKFSVAELLNAENKGITPMSAAASAGSRAIVSELIANGAEINLPGETGPLAVAALWGHGDLAAFLIEKGADVNARNDQGCTPLHFAAMARQKSVVELLIREGADVNAKTNDGQTPLFYANFMWAPGLGGDKDVPKILKSHGGRE